VVANNIFAVVNGVKMNHVAVSDIREEDRHRLTRADRDSQKLFYGVELNVKTERLRRPSNPVERLSMIRQESQHPVVGDKIFPIELDIVAGQGERSGVGSSCRQD
jgi:isopropylmalate/homocitrate/citramalate synthase